MPRVRGTVDRTCIVCGHGLGPYGRICDKCGSIQRPVGGDGLLLPPDKLKACIRCGQPIPVEIQEEVCEECARIDAPGPVIWLDEETDPHRKTKMVARVSTAVSSVTTGALALVIILGGLNIVTGLLLCVACVALGASVTSWTVISRRPAHKVEYFAPIKQDQAKTESSK